MIPDFLTPKPLIAMLLALVFGGVGGLVAWQIGAPMPFLLGAFVTSTGLTLAQVRVFSIAPTIPMNVRNVFVAVIGVMIGGSFQAEVLASLGSLWLPALGVVVFVAISFGLNYLLFRHIGGYGTCTAFFSAMPGGLIESVVMGEKAGGDMQTISLQQFARIALVITLVPFIIQLWTGMKVGSAAGVVMPGAARDIAVLDMLILALCVPLGMLGGRAIRLPASILVGPMILSALAHITGLTAAGPPGWAITLSQVIVGAGLGARFQGFGVGSILRTFALSLVSVSMMFGLGAGMVWVLSGFVDQPVEVLFISFAPGGVTETALIALSLNANPVYVTTLHVFRIVVTVVGTSFGFRLLTGKV